MIGKKMTASRDSERTDIERAIETAKGDESFN